MRIRGDSLFRKKHIGCVRIMAFYVKLGKISIVTIGRKTSSIVSIKMWLSSAKQ